MLKNIFTIPLSDPFVAYDAMNIINEQHYPFDIQTGIENPHITVYTDEHSEVPASLQRYYTGELPQQEGRAKGR